MGEGYIIFSPFPLFVSVYVYASVRDFVYIALVSPFVLGICLSVFWFFFYLKHFFLFFLIIIFNFNNFILFYLTLLYPLSLFSFYIFSLLL